MKLHLGCGKRNFEGWINVDLADFPHVHHKSSVGDLKMFEDNSADLIYSAHTLEYFDRIEVVPVLKEWHRVLKKGATLRVAVPNFNALVELYLETGNLDVILGPLYGRMPIKSLTDDMILYHKTVYDFDTLKSLLENSGFTNVIRYDWRKVSHADQDDHSQAYYPHMDKEGGKLLSLNIEALSC